MNPIAISAIHEFHENNNAILAEVDGWMLPKRYAAIKDEYEIVENFVGIHDISSKVKLIQDGDIAGVIHTTEKATGIDMYMGIGGAPEGVLAAAALRCIGGQMQTKLVLEDQEKKDRASKQGIKDVDKILLVQGFQSDVTLSKPSVTILTI